MHRGKLCHKYLGPQHFSGKFSCFQYSTVKGGVFCAPCGLFAPQNAGGVKLDRLVKSPLQKFSHLTGDNGYLTSHLQNDFHEDCVTRTSAFVQTRQGRTSNVMQQLDATAAAQRDRNRRALERIIQAIEFYGRLGLPLRGHRDCGELQLPETSDDDTGSDTDYTQGNMRALLQLMVTCGDDVLKQHLITAGKNATYISPVSQNQIIDAIAAVIRRHIVADVKSTNFFAILADETTDFSRQEQLSVCVRYVSTIPYASDFCDLH